METNTILIIGFLGIAFLLWQILKELIDIKLHSEGTSKLLVEIKNEIKNVSPEEKGTDLRGSKLVDLSDVGDYLKKINDKLESIESLVDIINNKE
jgi:hypothetical protein